MPEQIIKMTANHRLVCLGARSEMVDQITVERLRMLWNGQTDEQRVKKSMEGFGLSKGDVEDFVKDAMDRGLIQGSQRTNERGQPWYFRLTDNGRSIVNQARYDTPDLPEVTPTVEDEKDFDDKQREFFACKEREKMAKQG
jgi:hypothetical protein